MIAHLFVPHHTNNHKAKILHNSSIFVLCLALIFAQVVISGISKFNKPTTSVLGYASQISKDEVIRLTNQKRQENGLSPLRENASLGNGAQTKGAHMLQLGYWAHVAPDGTEPWKFFRDVGYRYRYAGENLARDFSSPAAAVDAWMASPSHRENMLSPKYTEIGIGVVEGSLSGNDSTIIVQFFGSPLQTASVDTAQAPTTPVNTPEPSNIPTLAIAATPQPSLLPLPNSTPVTLVAGTGEINSLDLTKSLSGILVAALLIAFVVDLVVVSRNRISRNSGRSLAHLAFLGMTLGVVLIIQAGRIL